MPYLRGIKFWGSRRPQFTNPWNTWPSHPRLSPKPGDTPLTSLRSASLYLQRLVDAFGPVLVCLLGWKLCLLELQKLAPQDLWRQGVSATPRYHQDGQRAPAQVSMSTPPQSLQSWRGTCAPQRQQYGAGSTAAAATQAPGTPASAAAAPASRGASHHQGLRV